MTSVGKHAMLREPRRVSFEGHLSLYQNIREVTTTCVIAACCRSNFATTHGLWARIQPVFNRLIVVPHRRLAFRIASTRIPSLNVGTQRRISSFKTVLFTCAQARLQVSIAHRCTWSLWVDTDLQASHGCRNQWVCPKYCDLCASNPDKRCETESDLAPKQLEEKETLKTRCGAPLQAAVCCRDTPRGEQPDGAFALDGFNAKDFCIEVKCMLCLPAYLRLSCILTPVNTEKLILMCLDDPVHVRP